MLCGDPYMAANRQFALRRPNSGGGCCCPRVKGEQEALPPTVQAPVSVDVQNASRASWGEGMGELTIGTANANELHRASQPDALHRTPNLRALVWLPRKSVKCLCVLFLVFGSDAWNRTPAQLYSADPQSARFRGSCYGGAEDRLFSPKNQR